MKRVPKGILLLPLLGVALAAAPGSAAVNLLTNPGFEAAGGSYSGWTTFGSGVQLSSASGDSITHSGIEASKIYGEFSGCPIPSFDVGGYFQVLTPTAGMIYEFTGHSYVSSADPVPGTVSCSSNRCVAKLAFFDSPVGGAEIATNEIIIGDGSTPLDQWVPFEVATPAPAGAQRLEVLILYLQPGCDTGAVFVDDLSVCALTPPAPGANLLANPSFDNDLSGWTVFGNAVHEGRGETLPQFAFGRRTPPGAMKMYSTFVMGEDSGVYQGFAASPGSDWELEVYSLTTCQEDPIDGTSDSFVTAKISFLDASVPPVEIGFAEQTLVNADSPQGTWTKHRLVGNAPAGTQTVRAYFLFISPSLLPGDAVFLDDASFRQTTITDVAVAPRDLEFDLRQNAPNPFGGSTRIEFTMSRSDRVELDVYDVAGRRVARLLDGAVGSGTHVVTWDGTTSDGRSAAVGMYQYVLRTSTGKATRRMLLVK